jgi:hypothetical protein
MSNNDCLYLDRKSRLCTIYAECPDTCRNHPKIGPRPGYCAYKPKKWHARPARAVGHSISFNPLISHLRVNAARSLPQGRGRPLRLPTQSVEPITPDEQNASTLRSGVFCR